MSEHSTVIHPRQIPLFVVDRKYQIEDLPSKGKLLIESINELDDCQSSLKFFFSHATEIKDKIHNSDYIFIKINLTSGEKPDNGRTTHPHFLRLLIASLLDIGVNREHILVGDSSVIGINTLVAAKQAGIEEVCHEYNIPFIDLYEGPFKKAVSETYLLHRSISIHEIFSETNVFTINCAKIKTTYGSPVGFCVKNLKGIISDEDKLNFHLVGVQESLVDLRRTVTCDLNILEGYPGSELGVPKFCNLIGISTSDYILDSIVAELIGISFMSVPHLNILASEYSPLINKAISKYSSVETRKKIPKFKYTTHGIDSMAAEFSIEIIDGKPCTSCLESFYKALIKLSKENSLPLDFTYIIGQWHVNTDWHLYDSNKHIFLGQCALKRPPSYITKNFDNKYCDKFLRHIEENNKGIPLPGCPPTIDSMVKTIATKSKAKQEYLTSLNETLLQPVNSNFKHSRIIEQWVEPLPMQNFFTASIIPKVIEIMPKEVITFDNFSEELAIQCELVSAAICHQMNWDFIRNRIKEKALRDRTYWDFSNLKNFSEQGIIDLLKGYPKRERYFPEQRASMLRELSKLSFSKFETLSQVIKSLKGKKNIEENFLKILHQISVFSEDPEAKKLQVLLHSLFRSKLLNFDEKGIVQPTIDYHLMRLYIRRGNIWHTNSSGLKYLRSNIRRLSTTTSALRAIIADALRNISFYSKQSLVDINGAEWWIGRTLCSRENPDCEMQTGLGDWLKPHYNNCPYINVCYAKTCDIDLIEVNEPFDISRFY